MIGAILIDASKLEAMGLNVLDEVMTLLFYARWNFTPSVVVFVVNVLWVHFMVGVFVLHVGIGWE
jgi:hypothetical protein